MHPTGVPISLTFLGSKECDSITSMLRPINPEVMRPSALSAPINATLYNTVRKMALGLVQYQSYG